MDHDDKFNTLAELGAGDFRHLNGSLMEHLTGTAQLLKNWGANQVLQDAGLYHAAYGTAAFDTAMVDLTMRHRIAQTIGKDAEELVYLYCSCDRDVVFSRLNASDIRFKDRFDSTEFTLTIQQSRDFCELTVANEMELLLSSDEFKAQYADALLALFEKMTPWLSGEAILSYQKVLK